MLIVFRHGFMSPTDAMTSPCTQQLMNHHRYPRRQTRSADIYVHSLTNSFHIQLLLILVYINTRACVVSA